MDDFLGEHNSDLFDNILENRAFEAKMVSHQVVEDFTTRMKAEYQLFCFKCGSYPRKVMLFYKKAIFCVGCFAKQYDDEEDYLLVNLDTTIKRKSKWTLFQQLHILNQLYLCGIENCDSVSKVLPFKATTKMIEEYREKRLYAKATLNQPSRDAKAQQSVKEPWRVISESFTGSYLMNDYQLTDYLLANLHEQSTQQEIQYALSKKISEDNRQEIIMKKIDKMAQAHPIKSRAIKEIQEMEEESSMFDLFIEEKTDQEQFQKQTQLLLKQAAQIIQNNKILSQDQPDKKKDLHKNPKKKYIKNKSPRIQSKHLKLKTAQRR